MTNELRRGTIIQLHDNKKKGVVIDWGVYNQKYKKYVLSKKDAADYIRVWTDDAIEVWPINKINNHII